VNSGSVLGALKPPAGPLTPALSPQAGRGGNAGFNLAGVITGRVTVLLRLIGHADVRWHLWIGLALLGRLEIALLFYAFYFALRATGGVLRKAVRHA
jgi:hypothetical protein